MTTQPEDPLIWHGGRADEPYREERERGGRLVEEEAQFAPRGVDDRQTDLPPVEADDDPDNVEQAASPADQPVADAAHPDDAEDLED